MKIKDIANIFRTELKDIYPCSEIEAMIAVSVNETLGLTKGELEINGDRLLKVPDYEKLRKIVGKLKEKQPLQYILGTVEFYGCKLRVNEHVLIPRPETEELVDWIIGDSRSMKPDIQILDIGCGSGCIPIALKKHIPDATVSALDISEEALMIAKANSILNHTRIAFLQADILNIDPKSEHSTRKFNIIVSNPPYVKLSEKEKIDKNVIDFEPHEALFVNDNDPMIFYKIIAEFALHNLSENGKIYFEINESMGEGIKEILTTKNFRNIEVRMDISGKDRMVKAEL